MKTGSKLLTLNITPSCVYALEGAMRDDVSVSKFFSIPDVGEFFEKLPDANINNMGGLVRTIVNECEHQRVTARKVIVCLPFGIDTQLNCAQAKGNIMELLRQESGGKNKKTADKKKEKKTQPGKTNMQINWGNVILDGQNTNSTTVTNGEQYMLRSLAREFYNYGFTLIGVTSTVGALIPFRQIEEADFDAQGKVLINYESPSNVTTVALYRDTPVAIDTTARAQAENIGDQITRIVVDQLTTAGRSPKVFLSGGALSDPRAYSNVVNVLRSNGTKVVDIFGISDKDLEPEVGEVDEMQPPSFTPDYGINIGLLMMNSGKNILLNPGVGLGAIVSKNSKLVGYAALAVSIFAFAATALLGGIRVVNLITMKREPSSVGTYQAQISKLQQEQQRMGGTIEILSQTDSTVLNVLEFVQKNDSDRVRVISVDTQEMLVVGGATGDVAVKDSFAVTGTSTGSESTAAPAPAASGKTGSEAVTAGSEAATTGSEAGMSGSESGASGSEAGVPGDIVTGGVGGTTTNTLREAIILRGYARTGYEAVNYFQKLFNSGLVSDPVLNGVERQELPSGEEIYVFEIKIGGSIE